MSKPVKIKFVTKNQFDQGHFTLLPNKYLNHEYIFDPEARDYDWFVVYDDLPRKGDEKLPLRTESLSCPKANTILITYEPSSIKYYGQDYINQFAHVFTSHEAENLKHPSSHVVPPVGRWYYGPTDHALRQPNIEDKTGIISTFSSPKAMTHTLHGLRYEFLEKVKPHLPELAFFGKGHQFVEHKSEAIDPYSYHIAIENHVGPDHWTEKLSDSFLGLNLPFYAGCTNLSDYFPKESYISIDMRDPIGASKIIKQAIENNEFEKRLPALIEARRRVMEDYNLANFIGKTIEANSHQSDGAKDEKAKILSRHNMMRKSPLIFTRYAIGKTLRRYKAKRLANAYCNSI
jgi:hypothetical protein